MPFVLTGYPILDGALILAAYWWLWCLLTADRRQAVTRRVQDAIGGERAHEEWARDFRAKQQAEEVTPASPKPDCRDMFALYQDGEREEAEYARSQDY